ncbi:hypothetical protein Tco_1012423 [Tanacetum coccineum]
MLNGAVLSKHFLTKAVRIARYTQNRSIIDHLGKFYAKAGDGYFLGYSFVSKAFRVFNTKRQQIEETYHVTFDESEEASGPPNLVNTEGTQEQNVRNELINSQPTEESLGYNTETSVPITEPSVFEVTRSQINHHASTSSYLAPRVRWSRDQHIEPVNIIDKPTKGMLTESMAAKLTTASTRECLFADFLFETEPKKMPEALKRPWWVDAIQE